MRLVARGLYSLGTRLPHAGDKRQRSSCGKFELKTSLVQTGRSQCAHSPKAASQTDSRGAATPGNGPKRPNLLESKAGAGMNTRLCRHPLGEILDRQLPVFSPVVDDLIREIAGMVSRYRLLYLFHWLSPPPLPEFDAELRRIRNKLRVELSERDRQGAVVQCPGFASSSTAGERESLDDTTSCADQ